MADEVFMDIPAVQRMADNFGNFAGVLKSVSKTLESANNMLKSPAFIGRVGGAALEKYIRSIKPKIDKLATKMEELQRDVNDAIKSFRDGDTTGSKHFQS